MAREVDGGPYWPGWDIARGVAFLPNNTGGYIVDAYGGIHPFALGSQLDAAGIIGAPYWNGQDMARGITIMPNGKGGYINDRTGKLWGFKVGNSGTVPATPNSVSIITATSVQGVSIMFDGSGGFTVDGWGGLHGFGVGASGPPSAFGGPYWPCWTSPWTSRRCPTSDPHPIGPSRLQEDATPGNVPGVVSLSGPGPRPMMPRKLTCPAGVVQRQNISFPS